MYYVYLKHKLGGGGSHFELKIVNAMELYWTSFKVV